MNLKETDYKLLSYLYHSYREPVSKIAKETGLTRDQVRYKIDRYINEKLILEFFPIVNWAKLGYSSIVSFFIRIKSPSKRDSVIKKLGEIKNCISVVEIFGKYDLGIDCIFKDEEEVGKFVETFFESNSSIEDYVILRPIFSEIYPLKIFHSKKKEDYLLSEGGEEIKLDELDKKILKILSENGREKIVDIAGKCGVSAENVLYRMRRLKKERIILGNRIAFNKSLLGYSSAIVLLNFSFLSGENKEAIKKFVRNSKISNTLAFNLGKPKCVIQLLYKEDKEIKNFIKETRHLLEKETVEIDLLLTGEEEIVVNTIPFL